jgi:methionyl-tRNA formyltransferase
VSQPLRIALIGCVHFSETMLRSLLSSPDVAVQGVVTRRQSAINADFVDLTPLAAQHHVPVFHAEGNAQDAMAAWLRGLELDAIFCLGWSYLLKPELLSLAPQGVVGYHPALLPRNRGRHPIIWALALGLPETGSTFFRMDAGADSGPILSQRRLAIAPDDDAAALYARLEAVAQQQIGELAQGLRQGTVKVVPQEAAKATAWRKRGRQDGRIDWRMTAPAIYNLVRALARPYPGAHCDTPGGEVKIWRCRLGPESAADIEPGFVLSVSGRDLHVQCGLGSSLIVEQHEFSVLPQPGDYL